MRIGTRRELGMTVVLWLASAVSGAILFWLVQTLSGGPTIPDFMGEQIVAGGDYPRTLAAAIGWAVHLGVSLSYALLVAVIAVALTRLSFRVAALVSLVAVLVLAWVTALIAPPAISVTISLLTGQGWPQELFPLNTELGMPFWNHVSFFLLGWIVQVIGPRVLRTGCGTLGECRE